MWLEEGIVHYLNNTKRHEDWKNWGKAAPSSQKIYKTVWQKSGISGKLQSTIIGVGTWNVLIKYHVLNMKDITFSLRRKIPQFLILNGTESSSLDRKPMIQESLQHPSELKENLNVIQWYSTKISGDNAEKKSLNAKLILYDACHMICICTRRMIKYMISCFLRKCALPRWLSYLFLANYWKLYNPGLKMFFFKNIAENRTIHVARISW